MEHVYLDQLDRSDLIEGVLKRLEPWLDFEMWSRIEARKKATRVNVDYEEQQRQMREGTWEVDAENLSAQPVIEELDTIAVEEH